MYEASYDLLELRPKIDLLEIGSGNGAFIAEILHRIQPGSYSGVEISDTMLRQAGKRNRKEIQQGRVHLLKGAAEKLPFQADRFSRVLTVNTLCFWKDPPQVLREVKRVLRKDGRFVVSFASKASLGQAGFTRERFALYDREEVEGLLETAGLKDIKTTQMKLKKQDVYCIRAMK